MYINVVPASENPIHVATVPIWCSEIVFYCIALWHTFLSKCKFNMTVISIYMYNHEHLMS